MVPGLTGLDRSRVEALVSQLLAGSPGLERQEGPAGTVYFVRVGDGCTREPGPPDVRMCAIGTDGGVLLRLHAEDRANHVANGSVTPNAALPDWVGQVAVYVAHRSGTDLARIKGDPEEWVWVPVQDEHGFTKRRPIILEAVAYARHRLERPGDDVPTGRAARRRDDGLTDAPA